MKTILLFLWLPLCINAFGQSFNQSIVSDIKLNSEETKNCLNKQDSDVLLKDLWSQIESGKLKAYSIINDKRLTIDEIKALVMPADTFYVEEPETPQNHSMRIVKHETNLFFTAEVLRFDEELSLNKKGVIKREVKWIIPMVPRYDHVTGELKGLQALFQLKA